MGADSKSFWSTIPGLITGLAGVLTAIVGLGTLLIQLGVIGDGGGGSTKTGRSTATTLAPGSGGSGGSSGSQSGTATTRAVKTFGVSPETVTLKGNEKASIMVRNTGNAALLLVPEVTGRDADKFTVDDGSCSSELAPQDSCVLTVSFEGGLVAEATLEVTASGAPSRDVELHGSAL